MQDLGMQDLGFQDLGMKDLVIVVFADAGLDAVIPAVQPAEQVVALDRAVGEQCDAGSARTARRRHHHNG